MNLIDRAKAPTPKFFRVLRTVGLALTAAGATLIAAPVAIPVGLITMAGYLAVAGSVMTAVSQITVDGESDTKQKAVTANGHGGTVAGTAGGTLLTIFANIHSEDVVKTTVLAVIGAAASFTISLLLKWIAKKLRRT